MNEIVRDILIEKIRQARELSRIISKVPHSGVVGSLRESFLTSILKEYLPDGYKISNGHILDSTNSKRNVNEDDVIIHCPSLIPSTINLGETDLILYDSVISRIEVKSTLTTKTLEHCINGANSMRSLVPVYDGSLELNAIFAYKTSMNKKDVLEIIMNKSPLINGKKQPNICSICVDDKFALIYGSIDCDGLEEIGWYDISFDNPTLSFIASLSSSLNNIKNSRQHIQFGKYSCDFTKAVRL